MIRLYRAADLVQAWLLRDLLLRNGIGALVFNEHAQGGAGQLPVTETYPEVWIEDSVDEARARALVVNFESAIGSDGQERLCSACGESNPAAFEMCWNCGGSL